jgi:hypothetical protein
MLPKKKLRGIPLMLARESITAIKLQAQSGNLPAFFTFMQSLRAEAGGGVPMGEFPSSPTRKIGPKFMPEGP